MRESPVGTLYLLKRAELAVRSCCEVALAEFDLTPTQFLLMYHLRDRHEVSAAELAREIGVRPQSIIEIIAPLERKRLVKRAASPAHRRILHTWLTPAGEQLFANALQVAARIEAELLADVSTARIAPFQDTLGKLWERAEQHELHRGATRAQEKSDERSPQQSRIHHGRRERHRSGNGRRPRRSGHEGGARRSPEGSHR
jgi:DNA-binding MarR family transcriptional regulator